MDAVNSPVLCQSDEVLSVSEREECARIIDTMSQQARHSLYIFSDELEPQLYDTGSFTDSIRRIVAAEPKAQIRILLYSLDKLISRGSRLLELSRRLASHVEIRQLSRSYHHAFFVADRCGVLDRRVAERFEGIANFNNPGQAAELIDFFNRTWEVSSRNTELQSLQL